MIPATSNHLWDTDISTNLFIVLIIHSMAHKFFCPVTNNRAKFSWNAVVGIFTSISIQVQSRAHHIPILTSLWAMSSALSILVRYTKICRSLFSSFGIPCSRTHHFLFPVTVNGTKFARVTGIRHCTSLSVHSSWAHHVFTTIHWTIIIAISIFHWDTEISSQLLGPVLIPFSRAHHFFFIVTSYWFKFLGLTATANARSKMQAFMLNRIGDL